ncbi:protein CHUP1, chloroplastic-like isoform X1 [Hibiscus syriacus]|uniref:protein CHUP1, chloroplastic-like isoform X1 n=1 Tax=Hibiscus syriacus TaxID=106335 RepID=UPI0019212524|nr:protein CHUP1, chloroplastic-like isoform X1 [Hibiscus syriacus]XP_039004597.1 protein CHUP1, chloroplastic-like isoform X1 [Hibiscus syriacus]
MSREKRDLRPLLLKFAVAVAISSAGFIYSRRRTRKTKPYLPLPPPSRRVSDYCSESDDCGNDDVSDLRTAPASDPEEISAQRASVENASVVLPPGSRQGGYVFLFPEFNDLVKEFDTSRTFRTAKKDDHEQEIKHLRNMIRTLRERERNLEVQLLEYYGLKEQEAVVLELENQLKINNMEAKLFTLKIASLQSENQRLENQVADHAKVVAELEAAKSRIKVLKKKLRHEAEQNREQIRSVQKRVASLKEQELKAPADNLHIESKLERLKVLEGEAEELRKSNTKFQIENSELARKLESTQIHANSVLEDPESEAINKTRERLRQENEDLKKQIDQLHEDRCADAEELVYLRWVNACLRYELRNFPSIPGKTIARDLSKSPNPESEKKAKKLILEYARAEGMGDRGMDSTDFDCDHCSCSQAFYGTENGEAVDSTIGNSSAMEIPTSRKNKFFKKLRRLILGKDVSTSSRKSDNMEDADSLTWSSGRGNDLVNRLRSNNDRFTTPSQTSPATTLDVDKVKDIDKLRRNSDCGSYRHKGFSSGWDESPLKPQLNHGSYSHRRSDVTKFAEALKL